MSQSHFAPGLLVFLLGNALVRQLSSEEGS